MSEPQELLEGVPLGEGHFVRTTGERITAEAFHVILGQARGGKLVTGLGPGATQPSQVLERHDLIFILDAKKRNWRANRASASEREYVLRIVGLLVQSGLTASSVVRNLSLSPRTYSNWKRKADIS